MNMLSALAFVSILLMAAHPAVAQQRNGDAAPVGTIPLDHPKVDDNSHPIGDMNGDANDSASQRIDPVPDVPPSQDSDLKFPSNPLTSSTLCIADDQCKLPGESPDVPVR
jgi:hypothetical protein